MGIIGLIDTDILIYRACFKSIKDHLDPKSTFDELLKDIKQQICCDSYELHVSGPSNFRKELNQTFVSYKGTRNKKPENYPELKAYVIANYDVVRQKGYEADDTIAIRATQLLKSGRIFIITSVDKDLKQIGGLFYNMRTKSLSVLSKAECILEFHMQLLTGDAVDNVKGIEGIGIIKATRLLKNKDNIKQFDTIIATYKEHYPNDYIDRLNAMGSMLYLVRDETDPIWNIDWWIKQLQKGLNK